MVAAADIFRNRSGYTSRMTRQEILIEVESELARLLQVRRLLSESAKSLKKIDRITERAVALTIKNSLDDRTTSKTPAKRHQLSAEGRRRIIQGQKKRWALQRTKKRH